MLGARPEQIVLRRAGGESASLQMIVTFVERVGARTIIHLERGGHVMKAAEKNGYRAERGEPMSVVIPPAAASLFDAQSGRRLRGLGH